MFHNFLITIARLKNGMGLKQNTMHMRIFIFLIDYIAEKWKFIIKKTMKLELLLPLMIIIQKAQEL